MNGPPALWKVTSPVLTSNAVNLPVVVGSIGMPLPSTDISLRDENGREVKIGEAYGILMDRVAQSEALQSWWNEHITKLVTEMPDGPWVDELLSDSAATRLSVVRES